MGRSGRLREEEAKSGSRVLQNCQLEAKRDQMQQIDLQEIVVDIIKRGFGKGKRYYNGERKPRDGEVMLRVSKERNQ